MFNFSQLKYPLIQAPMAGGPNTAEMVSTVANAGAVGSYGFAYNNADKISQGLIAAKEKIDTQSVGALNANFFFFREVKAPNTDIIEAAVDSLRQVSDNSIEPTIPQAPYFPDLSAQLEPIWEHRPDILTFHFGIPDKAVIDKAHSLNMAVGITATCSDEAIEIENSGADFIVAQGIEAGGHRGIFSPANYDEALSCFDLIKVLSQVTRLPLVAAGGIMNGDHIRKALSLGATAVQMGTAFLTTNESGTPKAHRDYLLNQQDRTAVITHGFSGRPARGIDNRFIRKMKDKPVLPFPLQNTLTGRIRATAIANNDGEYQSLWAGSHFRECQQETVIDLIERLFKPLTTCNS